jgi:hypothetical protein
VGRGGAGERPRLLWCCGGTRGLAVAQEPAAGAWAPGFVTMCGAARTAQGGGRRKGEVVKGGGWLHGSGEQSTSTSTTTIAHKRTLKRKSKRNYTRSQLHIRTCSPSCIALCQSIMVASRTSSVHEQVGALGQGVSKAPPHVPVAVPGPERERRGEGEGRGNGNEGGGGGGARERHRDRRGRRAPRLDRLSRLAVD